MSRSSVELSRPKCTADRAVAEELVQHGREEVLAGVLLHVVEAAGPVHAAVHGRPVDRVGEQVGDAVTLVHDVHHRGAAEGPGVVRLAARGGIEGGAVEVYSAAAVGTVHDGGVEVAQVGVGVVEAEGHDG